MIPNSTHLDTADEILQEKQRQAKNFINNLSPVGMLRNVSWEKDQRPSYIYMVNFDDIKEFIDNRADNLKNKKWPAEIDELCFVNAANLVDALSDHASKFPHADKIAYGDFIEFEGMKIYDAFARTVINSLSEIRTVL